MNIQRINKLLLIASFILVGSVSLMTCKPKGGEVTATDSTKTATTSTGGAGATADRGRYLVNGIGCNDCHTPWTMGPQGPAPDMTRMLSGHPAGMKIASPAKLEMPWMWGGDMTMTAFSGPWGVSFAANLTPDSLTGIGAWTQDVFVSAIKTGKHMGKGRQILPPMPWPSLKNLTDDDLASMYLYLKTIPAMSNQVPEAIIIPPPPPGSMGAPPMPPGAPVHPVPPTAPSKSKSYK